MAGQGLTLLDSRLSAKLSTSATFNPANLIAIIQAIVAAISNCPSPTPAGLKVRLGNRVRLTVGIKQQLPSATYQDCFTYADAAFSCANEATDAESQSLIDDCTT